MCGLTSHLHGAVHTSPSTLTSSPPPYRHQQRLPIAHRLQDDGLPIPPLRKVHLDRVVEALDARAAEPHGSLGVWFGGAVVGWVGMVPRRACLSCCCCSG